MEINVRGETLYRTGRTFFRLTPWGDKTVLPEAAEGEEEAAIGRFEDVTWYDYFLPEKETPDRAVLMRFKTDVIRCYAEDNFEAFLLSRGYRKKLDGRDAFYKKDGEEVRIVFDDTRAEMILERRFSDGISRKTFAEIVPEQTLTAMKDFMSARE